MSEVSGTTITTDATPGGVDSGAPLGGGSENGGTSDPLSGLAAYATDTADGSDAGLAPDQPTLYTAPRGDAPAFDPTGDVGRRADAAGQPDAITTLWDNPAGGPDAVTAPGAVTGEFGQPDALTAPGAVTGEGDAASQRGGDVGDEVGRILAGFETGGDGQGPGYLNGGADPYAAA